MDIDKEDVKEVEQGLKEISEGKVIPLWLVKRRQDIIEDMARGAYMWKSLLIKGLDTIEPFDSLTEEKRKPFYVLAHQLTTGLASKGVEIVDKGADLPIKAFKGETRRILIQQGFKKTYPLKEE